MDIDQSALRVELARRQLAQWRLALKLGLRPSTLSDYLRGARPAPPELAERIERALRLEQGSLTIEKSPPDRAA
jgi:DNA-binding transcriptional regulator YdaS (Cro superfamily)